MAVAAPIPNASVSTTVTTNRLWRRNPPTENLRSSASDVLAKISISLPECLALYTQSRPLLNFLHLYLKHPPQQSQLLNVRSAQCLYESDLAFIGYCRVHPR